MWISLIVFNLCYSVAFNLPYYKAAQSLSGIGDIMYAIALSAFCFFFTKICIEFNQNETTKKMIKWI